MLNIARGEDRTEVGPRVWGAGRYLKATPSRSVRNINITQSKPETSYNTYQYILISHRVNQRPAIIHINTY